MSDPIKAFKISDAVKQPVERPRPGQKAQPAPPPVASVGFPRIEALVESDAPDLTGIEARLLQLDELAKSSKSQKEKLAAARAAKSYEKTRALLQKLFATKQQMAPRGP